MKPTTYLISATIDLTAHVYVLGCGFQSDPISCGYGSTAGFDTRSTGFLGSVIVCPPSRRHANCIESPRRRGRDPARCKRLQSVPGRCPFLVSEGYGFRGHLDVRITSWFDEFVIEEFGAVSPPNDTAATLTRDRLFLGEWYFYRINLVMPSAGTVVSYGMSSVDRRQIGVL